VPEALATGALAAGFLTAGLAFDAALEADAPAFGALTTLVALAAAGALAGSAAKVLAATIDKTAVIKVFIFIFLD